jgi:hypothetical protein
VAKLRHVRATSTGITIDGTDFGRCVSSYELHVAHNQHAVVTMHCPTAEIEYDGPAEVRLDDTTRTALLALGWTEPADSDTQWGYGFVDSPTAVCGPVSELTARRKVDGDYSAELYSRATVGDKLGTWRKIETR